MSNNSLQVTLTGGTNVPAGTNVIFNNVIFMTGNISYNTVTGVITFNVPGEYAINWWVDTQSSTSPTGINFAISTSQGDFILGDSPIATGEVSGIALINVAAPGTTAQLVNATANDIVYSSIVPVQASLMAFEIDLGPTGPTGPTEPNVYAQQYLNLIVTPPCSCSSIVSIRAISISRLKLVNLLCF